MIEQETSTEIIVNSDGSWKRVERMRYMEESNVRKLWHLCAEIQDFCSSHSDCDYCPFHVYVDGCRIKNATDERVEELLDLFPEDIMEDE